MSGTDPRVDAYLAKAKTWREEQAALRAILLACPVSEDFKWRSPCYTFRNGNVAILWALKECCAVGFFKGVLLNDPAGILVAPGENSRSMRKVEFASLVDIAEREALLKDYVHEAVEVEKAGRKVGFGTAGDLAFPEELVERLGGAPALKAAFEALTPGRRRGYLLHFSQPKQSATRVSRIEKCAPRILGGKGLHDR